MPRWFSICAGLAVVPRGASDFGGVGQTPSVAAAGCGDDRRHGHCPPAWAGDRRAHGAVAATAHDWGGQIALVWPACRGAAGAGQPSRSGRCPSKDRVIGAVLRTRLRSNPLYISPGHLMDVPTAVELVQQCLRGYRLPEPTRWAHKLAAGESLKIEN